MRLGAPLGPHAIRVLLLGSGELGKEMTIAFQRLGVEVVAVDRYPNAPAQQVAHRAYVIDMTDAQALSDLIAQEQPHFIVPEIEALNTPTLLAIEKSAGVTVVPTARAVHLTMNREGIRRLAAETLNLPTSRYAFANDERALETAINHGIGYPCFVKPTMSSSGKGQSRLTCAEDITAAWQKAISAGRVNLGTVIVEGQIDFDYEITLLTVRAKNADGSIDTHFCAPIGHRQEAGDYVESWQPQAMSAKALLAAQRIAASVTSELGGLGLFGVELFVRGDEVWFSEVSPRPHDTGMVTMLSQTLNEFELHVRAILGLPVDVSLRHPQQITASAVIYGQHDSEHLVFEGLVEALRVPTAEVRLFGKPLALVKRRMGVALASGVDVDEARQRARLVASHLRAVGYPP